MKLQQEDVSEEFLRQLIQDHQGAPLPWPVERILVATDFSLFCLHALGHGEELTRRLDAELLPLHVEAV
jgi:hypothetical protein